LNDSLPQGLLEIFRQRFGSDLRVDLESVSGGCVNITQRIKVGGEGFFLKLGSKEAHVMYSGEAEGLLELSKADAFRIPKVVDRGKDDEHAWLLLEWLDLGTPLEMEEAGRLLAQQHRVVSDNHGFRSDNHIGATPQKNGQDQDWVTFFGLHRLKALSDLGYSKGLKFSQLNLLLEKMPTFFGNRTVEPSLLHGDLWSGNISGLNGGGVAVYDPAVHYGDRECDLAMTELFGGFSRFFYDAYNEAYPVDDGYELRKGLYQLYHIMNHALLFGGSYVSQSGRLIDRLLKMN